MVNIVSTRVMEYLDKVNSLDPRTFCYQPDVDLFSRSDFISPLHSEEDEIGKMSVVKYWRDVNA